MPHPRTTPIVIFLGGLLAGFLLVTTLLRDRPISVTGSTPSRNGQHYCPGKQKRKPVGVWCYDNVKCKYDRNGNPSCGALCPHGLIVCPGDTDRCTMPPCEPESSSSSSTQGCPDVPCKPNEVCINITTNPEEPNMYCQAVCKSSEVSCGDSEEWTCCPTDVGCDGNSCAAPIAEESDASESSLLGELCGKDDQGNLNFCKPDEECVQSYDYNDRPIRFCRKRQWQNSGNVDRRLRPQP